MGRSSRNPDVLLSLNDQSIEVWSRKGLKVPYSSLNFLLYVCAFFFSSFSFGFDDWSPSRVIRGIGAGSGWMSTTVSVYIAESSPAHLRGRLVAFQSVLITMGRFCGALASAVAFTLYPPVTGRKEPVLMMTTDLLTSTKAAGAHHQHWPFRLQWLDVLNFSSRRSVPPVSIDRPPPPCLVLLYVVPLVQTIPTFDVYRQAP